MAAPLKERPKVLIPLPPLPEFYQNATEGDTTASSSASTSSRAKKTAKSHKSSKKVVATVEVRSKSKGDSRPLVTPGLPPAKPLPLEVIVDAKPTAFDAHSLPPPPVKLPPFPPPPPPPGFELGNNENMTHRYSYHHRHTSKYPVYEAKPTKDPQPQPARIIAIPPPPPGFPGVLVEAEPVAQTTLTVYHVCRICMRPRSEKYHLEHPISSDGVPPPPGICRRCRITSVEEKNDYTKVAYVEESDKVRVGISAFLPRDNLYTQREASAAIEKQQRRGYGEIYVRQPSPEEEEPERVVYRYVKRTMKSIPDPPPVERPEVSVENLAAMNLMNDRSPRFATKHTTMKVQVGSDYESPPAGSTIQYPAQNVRVAEIRRVERSEAPDSLLSSKSSTPSVSTAKDNVASSAKASVSVKSSAASNESSVKATAQVTATATPGYTESEIRTFARDEVERYRQAERMMHAHPNAYAHGRMVPVVTPEVPVERRIEAVRDTAAPRPWEAPASPPKEAAFATLKGRFSSTASKDGTGCVERGPSEESRHWYLPTESSSSATKSTSSKGSTSTIRQQSTKQSGGHRSSGLREYDTEVIIEHKSRAEPSRGLPESDAPASVKLREVVGVIREEPTHEKQRSVSSGRHYSPDIIEVTEEIELPPGAQLRAASIRASSPAVSQRVKILRAGHGSQQRASRSPQSGRDPGINREASLRTDKSYWEGEGVARTASRHSSARQDESEVRGSERQSEARTDVAIRETKDVLSTAPPRQFLPNLSSHGRSDDDSWYASRVKTVRKHQQMPEQPSNPPYPQDDEDDKTLWPRDDMPVRPAASSRGSKVEDVVDDDDDWDWEYRKRTVTASDRPPGRRDDESAPGRHYTDTERMFRRRRPSDTSARDPEPSTHSSRAQARISSRAPPVPEIVISTEVDQESSQKRGREPYMRTSEESAHVHFASKVEFSPTPPRSDESLPEQVRQSKPSSRSSRASTKKSALRNQVEGGASEPPESAEYLFTEYETTRARRNRSVEREEDFDYVSVKHASSARGSGHSGATAQNSTRSQPRSFRSQESRRSTRTRKDDSSAQAPPHDDEDERRSRRSARRSSPDDTETATQVSRSRRLARALSESPSRERMQQEYFRIQQQQEQKTETVVSLGTQSGGEEPKEDGKGPYRDERRTESMDALYGSGHGGPKSKQREYVVREKW